LPGCVRRCGKVTAIDGRASCSICYYSPVSVKLTQELDVGCLATAGAGTTELEERFQKLRSLCRVCVYLFPSDVRNFVEEEIPVGGFRLAEWRLGFHDECLVACLVTLGI